MVESRKEMDKKNIRGSCLSLCQFGFMAVLSHIIQRKDITRMEGIDYISLSIHTYFEYLNIPL